MAKKKRKITLEQIDLIIALHCSGMSLDYIAEKAGVGRSTVKAYVEAGSPKQFYLNYARSRGFDSWTDYLNSQAQKRGFDSHADYNNHLRKRKKSENK